MKKIMYESSTDAKRRKKVPVLGPCLGKGTEGSEIFAQLTNWSGQNRGIKGLFSCYFRFPNT
jgi:hypothetical protein